MRFTVSGSAYTFSERAPERSSVLGRCKRIDGSSEQAVTDLPLPLEHVQAWDNEVPLEELDQEALLGVIKVRCRPCVRAGACPRYAHGCCSQTYPSRCFELQAPLSVNSASFLTGDACNCRSQTIWALQMCRLRVSASARRSCGATAARRQHGRCSRPSPKLCAASCSRTTQC